MASYFLTYYPCNEKTIAILATNTLFIAMSWRSKSEEGIIIFADDLFPALLEGLEAIQSPKQIAVVCSKSERSQILASSVVLSLQNNSYSCTLLAKAVPHVPVEVVNDVQILLPFDGFIFNFYLHFNTPTLGLLLSLQLEEVAFSASQRHSH
jgi:hypothetical protein